MHTKLLHIQKALKAERRVAIQLSRADSLADALRKVLSSSLQIDEVDCGGVYMVDLRTGALRLVVHRGLPGFFIKKTNFYHAVTAQARKVRGRKPIYIDRNDIVKYGLQSIRQRAGLKALASIPIVYRRQVVAALNVGSRSTERFSSSSRLAIEALAAQVGGYLARWRSEEALRQSEALYRAVVEGQTEMICRFRPGGILTFANESYARFFGKTRAQLVGTSFLKLIPTSERSRIEKSLAGLTPRKRTVTYEHRVLDRQGRLGWQHWTTQAFFDRRGRLIEYQAVGRDITERKKVDLALQDSEERYRQITELAFDRISLTTIGDFRYVFINRAGAESLGYTKEHLIGRSVLEFLHPDDRTQFQRFKKELFAKERVLFELRYRRSGGDYCWLEVHGQLIRDHQGRRRALFVSRDITERRQRQMIAASESEQRRIGGDLHDGLGQHLAGIQMLVSIFKQRLRRDTPEQLAAAVDEIEKLVGGALEQTNKIARNL